MTPRTARLRHQALCITDGEPAVGAALARLLADPALVCALVGPDADLTVDVTPLPGELHGRLLPATTSISLAVDDLETRIAACRAANLNVTVGLGPGDLPYAIVIAAGLEFELVGWR